jgi:hypothetical protein
LCADDKLELATGEERFLDARDADDRFELQGGDLASVAPTTASSPQQ